MTRAAVALVLTIGIARAPATTEPPIRPPASAHRVNSVHITVLSTMLADKGVGEWGFAALIEADGHRLLFDTGDRPETVLQNARELGIDLSTVPEDMARVVNTDKGLVVVTGCGHAGTINTLEYAREVVAPEPLYALIGGLHLFAATEEALAWTAGKLRAAGLVNLLGAHCTGIEAVFRIRQLAGLTRRTAVVAAVRASVYLGSGLGSPAPAP